MPREKVVKNLLSLSFSVPFPADLSRYPHMFQLLFSHNVAENDEILLTFVISCDCILASFMITLAVQ